MKYIKPMLEVYDAETLAKIEAQAASCSAGTCGAGLCSTGVCGTTNMPIFLRSKENLPSQYTAFDEEHVCRKVFIPATRLETVEDIDLIFFPHYSAYSNKKIQRVNGTLLFKSIMNNIRFYNNRALLLKDVAKLSNDSIAYDIYYNCFDWVDELIK